MHLPSALEVSIEGLEAGAQVTAGDVTLPEGTELAVDADLVIAIVSAAQTAEQMEGDSADAAAAAEAEAAAPADAS